MARVFRQAALLAAKDLRIFARDRWGLIFALGFPLVFALAFSFVMGDLDASDTTLTLTVVTEEGEDGLSRQIVDGLLAQADAPFRELSLDDARQRLADGTLGGYILFPLGFTAALTAGEQAHLEVISHPEALRLRAALQGAATYIAGHLSTVSAAVRSLAELRALEGAAPNPQDFALAQQPPPLIGYAVEPLGAVQPLPSSAFLLPGYLTMFVFFAAALSAEAIARERRTHTLERLMANGVRRESIVLGKYLGSTVRGLLQIGVLWTAALFLFGISLGFAPWAVILVSLLMVLASAGFGVLLAGFARTERSASSMAVLFSLVLAPLGGSWWPLFITPDWMQTLAKITPHGWANTAFNKLMLFGADGGDVLPEMAALLVFAGVFLGLALLRFRTAPAATK